MKSENIENKNIKKVGLIGIGVMGSSMARNLQNAGFEIYIHTRTASKAENLIESGMKWCDSIKSLSQQCDAIITIVGYPSDCESIYFGEHGIINNAKLGCYLIDMTTSTPDLAIRIANEAKKLSLIALDAPVSGGDIGAKNGTLSIMIGGDKADILACTKIFNALGKHIYHQGEHGAGQHTKAANQIAVSGATLAWVEALSYAKAQNLNLNKVIEAISGGAAGSWQLTNMAPRAISDDFAPGFFIKHFLKDMNIALDEAAKQGLELPALALAKSLYSSMVDNGYENLGTQALFQHYQNISDKK